MRALLFAGAIAGSFTGVVIGQTTRDLDVHDHGTARLTLVIENNSIYADFQSPWMNLLGFEHAPTTDADRQVVDRALELLSHPDALLAFTPDGCSAQHVEMEAGQTIHEGHNDQDDQDNRESHSDVLASYRFECSEGTMPSSMKASLLAIWKGIEELQVDFIGPGGQSAAKLTPDAPSVSLTPVL